MLSDLELRRMQRTTTSAPASKNTKLLSLKKNYLTIMLNVT